MGRSVLSVPKLPIPDAPPWLGRHWTAAARCCEIRVEPVTKRTDKPQHEAEKTKNTVSGVTFPTDPDYGSGVFRRRIRLTRGADHVLAELEDDMHAMVCRVAHDGHFVTGVEADFHRYPLTTCPGAIAPLRELVGLPVDIPTAELFAGGRARNNCTHMLDLAWLAVGHIRRDEAERLFAIDIPDQLDGTMHAILLRDNQPCLEWRLEKGIIITPGPFEGRNPLRGFTNWAMASIEGDLLESALVLQKGIFVSEVRELVMPPGPLSEAEHTGLAGVCFGYGSERITSAQRRESGRRDFTDHPERLLKFL